jgi:gliding motility-associated-like protein
LSVTDDSTGCIAKDNVKLTVTSSFPNAVLQNETINQGESVIIGSAPSYGINYNWSPATGLNSTTVSQPVAQPNATTTYTVTQTDMNGCTLKETLTVNVLQDPICDSTFYDGFSPNGDGVDDYWNIPLLTCYPVNEVTIINRWGNEVWKKTNYDNQSVRWIGQNMNGQDLADGIYYYNIVYQEKQKTGWILLKR